MKHKKHFYHLLFHCFDSKKTVIKIHRFILEIYSESVLSVKTCEYWFWRFESDDFDLKDKECSGQTKKFELQTLLDENSAQLNFRISWSIKSFL